MLTRAVEVGGAHFSPPTGGRSTQTSPYCASPALLSGDFPAPHTPSGRGFLAVDRLRDLLEADHAFLLRRDWRGRLRFETASTTRPYDELIDRVVASLRLPMPRGFRYHDLGVGPSRWLLSFRVTTPRGKPVAVLAAARESIWSDTEIAAGLDFAATFGRIA